MVSMLTIAATMTKQEAIEHFGSGAELARQLGIERSAVSLWGSEIPSGRQFQIEVLTKGKLKADPVERRRAAR